MPPAVDSPPLVSAAAVLLHAVSFGTSLHFGWISCATLVNANGYVATFPRAPNVLKLVASTLSVVAAVALSITVTAAYESPIYGTVVAWALWAIGSRAGWRNLEVRQK